jgi:hypothetical protein
MSLEYKSPFRLQGITQAPSLRQCHLVVTRRMPKKKPTIKKLLTSISKYLSA